MPTTSRRSAPSALLLLAVLATGLTACGSDAKKAAPASSTEAPPTTAAGTPDPNAAESNDPGDIPDDQVFVAYTPPGASFSVKVPEGWARSEKDGATTFTDKFNAIRITTEAAASAPTADTAKTVEVPALKASEKGFTLTSVTTVKRKSGPAVRTLYGADSEPNGVTGKSKRLDVERYEFWKAGTTVVLTLSGAKGADNVDPWKIVTDGFAWT